MYIGLKELMTMKWKRGMIGCVVIGWIAMLYVK